MPLSFDEFCGDPQGRTYTDVTGTSSRAFRNVLSVLNRPENIQRMCDAELIHDRPALAGVAVLLEAETDIHRALASADVGQSNRFRQAVGVAVRIIMERNGWSKKGVKGSVGVGECFNKAERYTRPQR